VGIVLIINPRSDGDFVREAERLAGDGFTQPKAFQAALRATYPTAAVHARELSGERTAVWYVYRDGSWMRDMEV
jgi:hypothetical protein